MTVAGRLLSLAWCSQPCLWPKGQAQSGVRGLFAPSPGDALRCLMCHGVQCGGWHEKYLALSLCLVL